MLKEFTTVSKEIIKNSISSAIYIDDEIVEPYQSDHSEDPFFETAQKIYKSFSENNCCLSIERFTEKKGHQQYNFKRKDLLVLDWQLNGIDPKYVSTLEILKKAIDAESLPFVYIYTKVPEKDFENILLNILSFFSGYKSDFISFIIKDLKEVFDEIGSDYEKFKYEFSSDFLTYLLKQEKYDIKEVKNLLEKYDESFKDLITKLHKKYELRSLGELFQIISYIINDAYFPNETNNDYLIAPNLDLKQVFINQTIIIIGNKIEPGEVFVKFTDAVVSISNNFLTVFSLELRNLIKTSPAFIENRLNSIDDIALFYHKDSIEPKEAYYDFLVDIWKNQMMSFLNKYLPKLSVYQALEDYQERNNIADKLLRSKETPDEFVKKLKELNYHYNTLIYNRFENEKISFGDIFKLSKNDTHNDLFLLCITAHCDCLYPTNKIKNQFFFVQGSKFNINNGIEKGDEGYTSFIEFEDDIICIEWKNKPFTIFIKEENNNISNKISVRFGGEDYSLEYLTTIKEKYAQRIANYAFTYPLHVGIYYAKFKSSNSK